MYLKLTMFKTVGSRRMEMMQNNLNSQILENPLGLPTVFLQEKLPISHRTDKHKSRKKSKTMFETQIMNACTTYVVSARPRMRRFYDDPDRMIRVQRAYWLRCRVLG